METGRLTAVAGSTGSSKRPVKIRIKHLIKRFQSLIAIDDVSLEIEEGTFFAIVGPSGCGKTTMLQIIAGFLRPSKGEVRFDGARVEHIPANRRRSHASARPQARGRRQAAIAGNPAAPAGLPAGFRIR